MTNHINPWWFIWFGNNSFQKNRCENKVFYLSPANLLFQTPCNSSIPAASIVSNEFHTHLVTPKPTRDQIFQQMTVDLARCWAELTKSASYLELVQKLPGFCYWNPKLLPTWCPSNGWIGAHPFQTNQLFPVVLKSSETWQQMWPRFVWDPPLPGRHTTSSFLQNNPWPKWFQSKAPDSPISPPLFTSASTSPAQTHQTTPCGRTSSACRVRKTRCFPRSVPCWLWASGPPAGCCEAHAWP